MRMRDWELSPKLVGAPAERNRLVVHDRARLLKALAPLVHAHALRDECAETCDGVKHKARLARLEGGDALEPSRRADDVDCLSPVQNAHEEANHVTCQDVQHDGDEVAQHERVEAAHAALAKVGAHGTKTLCTTCVNLSDHRVVPEDEDAYRHVDQQVRRIANHWQQLAQKHASNQLQSSAEHHYHDTRPNLLEPRHKLRGRWAQ
mmetsp:Transcript_19761/g.54413  ORF Transcript_19761/g.54413 Transcript_19761/m.54413 type:complete len:205 (-) Transcript_19761:275-889(-)